MFQIAPFILDKDTHNNQKMQFLNDDSLIREKKKAF